MSQAINIGSLRNIILLISRKNNMSSPEVDNQWLDAYKVIDMKCMLNHELVQAFNSKKRGKGWE